jgi:hypothetical protein
MYVKEHTLQGSDSTNFLAETRGLMGIKLPSGFREGFLSVGMDLANSHDSNGDMGDGGGISAESIGDPTRFIFGNLNEGENVTGGACQPECCSAHDSSFPLLLPT